MSIPKPRQIFLLAAFAVLGFFVMAACNNETAEKKEEAPAKQSDTLQTQKMDTADTRPVKTTN